MSYFGVRVLHNMSHITVKIHGPLDHIVVNTHDLREVANGLIKSYVTTNLPEICNRLSSDIRDRYCDGDEMVWVEVEILASTGVMYGTSAEKVLVT